MQIRLVVFFCFISSVISAQSLAKEWDRTYGGSNIDYVTCILRASNGNILMSGYSDSDSSGDKTGHDYGQWDFWIVYVDTNGNKIWDKTLGGNSDDECGVMLETHDHSFLIGGNTYSDSSGDITSPNIFNSEDYILFKIDSNGNKI